MKSWQGRSVCLCSGDRWTNVRCVWPFHSEERERCRLQVEAVLEVVLPRRWRRRLAF